jgi:hypothetical protein
MCYTPPLYTSNNLTRAEGFTPRGEEVWHHAGLGRHQCQFGAQDLRGTGYHKVPSFKGVRFRSTFGHSG